MCLLTVLWTVGRSAASQTQPPAGVGTALQPSEVARLILHDITSNIQPLVNKLASRIDGIDARLTSIDTRLNGIEARLNALDFKQDSFDVRLDGLTSGVETVSNRHEELVSQVDAMEHGLDSRLNELVSRVDSASNRHDSRLDEVISRVDGLATERDRLANVPSRLDSVSSRLDELANRTHLEQTDRSDRDCNPRDCSELHEGAQSGIHLIQPGLDPSQPPVAAYCDLETDGGGWTVIQRRADIQPRQDFNLGWAAYRDGFGQLDAEFWWGLEKVWRLTGPRDRQYELRVDLADFDGERRHAIYRVFRVASEADGYRLFVANYTGDAGDSLRIHSGQKFSTPDRDQDIHKKHCAQGWKSGWWFNNCYQSNLNGQYLSGTHGNKLAGVNWYHWRGHKYSLRDAVMMVRPVSAD